MKRFIFLLCASLSLLNLKQCSQEPGAIRILILSGSNNHDWKQTTNQLVSIFMESELFDCQVTNQPDSVRSEFLEQFDVIVNNWNSWPENDL